MRANASAEEQPLSLHSKSCFGRDSKGTCIPDSRLLFFIYQKCSKTFYWRCISGILIVSMYIFSSGSLPAALCNDHFRANLMELLPELVVLQRHLHAGQRDARGHYHVSRHRNGQHRWKWICMDGGNTI